MLYVGLDASDRITLSVPVRLGLLSLACAMVVLLSCGWLLEAAKEIKGLIGASVAQAGETITQLEQTTQHNSALVEEMAASGQRQWFRSSGRQGLLKVLIDSRNTTRSVCSAALSFRALTSAEPRSE